MEEEKIEIERKTSRVSSIWYPNKLTPRQMESLTALCDTFLPSVDASSFTADETLLKYYATSASSAGTPQRAGGVISSRLEHPKKWLMMVALWSLSTWYGTFIMCGIASLSTEFPYFQAFPRVAQHRRERIMRDWSRSYFFLLRILYAGVKFLTLLLFFSQVDEKEENQSWKAIGYSGPDPEFKDQLRSKQEENECSNNNDNGPLKTGIVDLMNESRAEEKLVSFGYRVERLSGQKPQRVSIECDAVVAGSGSGGAVVAGVLAMAGYKVVVLEKGNYYARTNLSLLEGPTMDQMYLSGGLMATDDMQVVLLAGSTVGGGSTVNWAASIRTPDHVAAEWCSRYNLKLFSSERYREALDAVCYRIGVQSEVAEEGLNNAVLRRGCHEMGYRVSNIPRNAPADHYCGWCCLGCKDGRKQGAAETWLVDAVKSGNCVILPGCNAVRVLRRNNTATGVEFEVENQTWVVKSKVSVIACGALRTPTLLKSSGLTNPNIGRNLHLHPVVMAWGYFPNETARKSYEGGIMTAMSTTPKDGVVIQTPALHPGMFSALMPWDSGRDIKDRVRRFPNTAHVFALARDRGSGRVESECSVAYDMDEEDEAALQRGLEKVLRILAAAGAEEIGTHHRDGDAINVKKASYVRVEEFIKGEGRKGVRGHARPVCSAHQMGSCRMGVDPDTSAVGPTGQTWEVEGLFVADSSVFPTALGVNPMVTVQAIAYCTAHSILQHLAATS